MTDTPETDDFERATCDGNESSLEFAREMERRCNKIHDAIDVLIDAKGRYNTETAYRRLMELAGIWKGRAKKKFADARNEEDETGKNSLNMARCATSTPLQKWSNLSAMVKMGDVIGRWCEYHG